MPLGLESHVQCADLKPCSYATSRLVRTQRHNSKCNQSIIHIYIQVHHS